MPKKQTKKGRVRDCDSGYFADVIDVGKKIVCTEVILPVHGSVAES